MTKKPIDDREQGIGRREVLECMVWAGTGVLWGMSGGVPHSVGLVGEAAAAESTGFTFLQMSDSHIGFDKKANPDALGTLRECAPDDRLRDEAIHTFFAARWIASLHSQ